jgi:hypothetical protein
MKVKVDKTVVASIALHVLVIGWGLISFSSRALEVPPDSVPLVHRFHQDDRRRPDR